MQKIGAYIASLRKERDLTQVELAEQLSVSHQAVSKWERGEALPDIGTLYDLASVFGVRVDDILHARTETERPGKNVHALVESVVKGEPEHAGELFQSGTVDLADLSDLAPMIKPSTLREVTSQAIGIPWRADDVTGLAPFLDSETLGQLITHVDASTWTWENISGIAPFVKHQALGELVRAQANQEPPTIRTVLSLAPFLDRETVEELTLKVEVDALDWQHLCGLAPFISRDALSRLVAGRFADSKPDSNTIVSLAPFLDREVLEGWVLQSDKSTWDWDNVCAIAPFVGSECLYAVADQCMDSVPDLNRLVAIAPFIGQERLRHLLQRVMERERS